MAKVIKNRIIGTSIQHLKRLNDNFDYIYDKLKVKKPNGKVLLTDNIIFANNSDSTKEGNSMSGIIKNRIIGTSIQDLKRLNDNFDYIHQQLATLGNGISISFKHHIGDIAWSKPLTSYTSYQIAIDSLNNTYVTYGDKGIKKFNTDGKEIWTRSDLQGGDSIITDIFDNIYVNFNNKIIKLNSSGDTISSYNVVIDRIMAIDKYGNIYASYSTYDATNGTREYIQKVSSNGALLWSLLIGNAPSSIAIDIFNNIYIACYQSGGGDKKTILKLNSNDGSTIWSKGSSVNYNVSYVATDNFGNVYFTYGESDASDMSLIKYDNTGNLLWSNYNEYNARFVAIDNSNNVYVCYGWHPGGILLIKYDSNGNILSQILQDADYSNFVSMGIDSNGDIVFGYVSDLSIKKIYCTDQYQINT